MLQHQPHGYSRRGAALGLDVIASTCLCAATARIRRAGSTGEGEELEASCDGGVVNLQPSHQYMKPALERREAILIFQIGCRP